MADELFDLGFNGITQSKAFEEGDEIITVESMPAGNVQAILDANKRDAEQFASKSRKGDLGVLGARIDIVTWHNWRQDWMKNVKPWGRPWHKYLKDRLNLVENKHLRFMKL